MCSHSATRATTHTTKHACGLCGHAHAWLCHIHTQRPLEGRRYWRCARCELIQVDAADRLSSQAEKALYDLHQNNPDDLHYQGFLTQVTQPLHQLLLAQRKPCATGLDFGAGPGPALPKILSALGHHCAVYDLYYANNPQHLNQTYDFICATEVFEHLAQPAAVLDQLWACLRPHGLLAVMMQRPDEQADFSRWGYLNDPTHISFYTNPALCFIESNWLLKEVFRTQNVVIWQHQPDAAVATYQIKQSS